MPSEVIIRLRLDSVLLCALAGFAANAQSTWQHELPVNNRFVRITDATETEDGYSLVSTLHVPTTFDMQGPGMAEKLDASGNMIASRLIWADSLTSPFVIIPNPSNGTFDILGDYGMQGEYGVFRVCLDNELNGIDSSLYHIPDAIGASLDNAMRASNGDLIIPAFYGLTLDAPHTSMILFRTGADGDSINSIRFISPWVLISRGVIESASGEYLIGCAGAPGLPEYSVFFVSYLRFDPDINYLGGFSGPRIDGTNALPTLQNTLYDQHCFLRLESGNLLVGGKIGSLSSGHKGAIQKITDEGAWLGSIVFDTPFHNDHPAILRNLTRDADGNLLFAMVANFESGPPSPFLPEEPSRVHVYKLDTALNVLCTNIIDGFAENAYYFVDRIIATSDGGYLLVGSRVDLSDPERPWVGWARKFSPDDCFTGMDEEAGAPLVHAAPNPGSDELRLTLNGPNRQATATLFDLNGCAISMEPLRFGQARFDTHDLAAGVYAYVLTDASGQRIASGRWVKE